MHKKMTLFPAILVFTAAIVSPAVPLVSAADVNWLNVGNAGDEKLLLDSSRFERQGTAVTAWIRVQYTKSQRMPFSDKKHDVSERLYFFQCADRNMILVKNVLYDGAAVVYEYDSARSGPLGGGVPAPSSVPAEGLDAAAFKVACDYKPSSRR